MVYDFIVGTVPMQKLLEILLRRNDGLKNPWSIALMVIMNCLSLLCTYLT